MRSLSFAENSTARRGGSSQVTRISLGISGGLCLGLAITGMMLLSGCRQRQPAAAPPPMAEVAVVTVQAQSVTLTTELPGRTSAYLIAEIRPQVSGLIQKRLFTEGANVQAGEVLYQIDPAPFEAARDQAAANLAAAKKGVDRANAVLKASQATVAQQQATLDLALTNGRRFDALAKEGVVSTSDHDKASTEIKVSQALLRAAENQVNSNMQAVAEAEAAIRQAEAALDATRISLGYTQITAPISGRIGKSNVTVGALVTAQQPLALATIQQLDQIYVDAPQSTSNLLQLKRDMAAGRIKTHNPDQATVKLLLEDGSAYPLEGSLKFSDVTVDASTGSFIFRMIFPNPEQTLLPGMFVRAVLEEGVVEQALLVPQQGVARDRKGEPYALIADAGDKVEYRPLTLERAIGDQWLVTGGLNTGDRVIVEGSQKVRPGASVKAVPFVAGQGNATAAGQPAKPTAEAN